MSKKSWIPEMFPQLQLNSNINEKCEWAIRDARASSRSTARSSQRSKPVSQGLLEYFQPTTESPNTPPKRGG